ncbi:MAG: hypothetical protein PHI11_14410 [Gallionella sp.]|nr:hypothetical protein [Gallionella sp.]
MSDLEEYIDKRRRLLIEMLTVGAFATVLPVRSAWAELPKRLYSGNLISEGTVRVNGELATATTRITARDTITTGDNYAIFVLSGNAVLLRANSSVTLTPENNNLEVIGGMRLDTGGLLSVSRLQQKRIETPSAIIDASGTGFYLESDADKTYCCICYGSIKVRSRATPKAKPVEVVDSKHHDRPLYVYKDPKDGVGYIEDAPFIRHSDAELKIIEKLVGRVPEFA